MSDYRIDRDKIDVLMKKADIKSYNQLAEKAEIHPNTLGRIFKGDTWTSATALKLASALGCNPIDFQVIDGFPDPDPKWDAQAAPLTTIA